MNFFLAFFSPLKSKTAPRLKRIDKYTYHIDQNATIAERYIQKVQWEKQHCELINLITPRLHRPLYGTMLFGKIPFHHLPSRRNSAFFGREDELNALWVALDPQARHSTLTFSACFGLAGVGKTQLALEFAHRHLDDFDAILWVAAETPLKMEESFHQIALGLGATDELAQHPDNVRDAMMAWFMRMSAIDGESNMPAAKWLVIFDNVEDASIVEPCWARTSAGAILVTCRNGETARQVSTRRNGIPLTVEVEPFSLLPAAEFLLTGLGISPPSRGDEKAAIHIARCVGHHPLALDLIGGYIRRCGLTMEQFTRQYPTPERDVLFHESSVANLWDMYLGDNGESGRGLDANAKLLIQMLALLDGDGAPLFLFTNMVREDMQVILVQACNSSH